MWTLCKHFVRSVLDAVSAFQLRPLAQVQTSLVARNEWCILQSSIAQGDRVDKVSSALVWQPEIRKLVRERKRTLVDSQ